MLECGVGSRVTVELDHDAFVQACQLTRHLGQIETLLPPMQAVSRRIPPLNVIALC
jgi:hypothetical protein